jgi:small subunit ribosomal protein S20
VLKLANIKSQIKRIKTNEKARQRNKAVRSEVRSYVRVVRENIAAGNKEEAQQAYAVAARKLDKGCFEGCSAQEQRCEPQVAPGYADQRSLSTTEAIASRGPNHTVRTPFSSPITT